VRDFFWLAITSKRGAAASEGVLVRVWDWRRHRSFYRPRAHAIHCYAFASEFHRERARQADNPRFGAIVGYVDRYPFDKAGIVYNHVDAAEMPCDLRDNIGDCAGIAHVHRPIASIPALRANFCCNGARKLAITIGHRNARTIARE
jgi:hypothetical protein